jgi:hypothetical protein
MPSVRFAIGRKAGETFWGTAIFAEGAYVKMALFSERMQRCAKRYLTTPALFER